MSVELAQSAGRFWDQIESVAREIDGAGGIADDWSLARQGCLHSNGGLEPPSSEPPLAEIEDFLDYYVAFPSREALHAVSLWVCHTHTVKATWVTPRLALMSDQPGSGKSRLLECLELLTPNPWLLSDPSHAALFRIIDSGSPTILFDEVDTIFGPGLGGERYRNLINQGYRKGRSPSVIRVEEKKTGERHPTGFRVFAPIALAGLGRLPSTIADRSIHIQMQPPSSATSLPRWRLPDAETRAEPVRSLLTLWAPESLERLGEAVPDIPDVLSDRKAEIWEPLFAIADMAEDGWSERARRSALALTGSAPVPKDRQIFVDIRDVCGELTEPRIRTEQLLHGLVNRGEGRWSSLTAKRLSMVLGRKGVRPGDLKVAGATLRGYDRHELLEVCSRYVRDVGPAA